MSYFVNVISGSDMETQTMSEKKRKRMISNRESARRSRMKKQKHLEDLISEKYELERRLYEGHQRCNAILQRHKILESENKILRDKKVELTRYLVFLNQIIQRHKGGGTSFDTNQSNSNNNAINVEVSDTFVNLWQVHGKQPNIASGMIKIQ